MLMVPQAAMDASNCVKKEAEEMIADDWEELDVKEKQETEVKREPESETVKSEPSDVGEKFQTSDDRLASEYRKQRMSKGYASMFEFRKKLPAYKQRRELIELVNSNQGRNSIDILQTSPDLSLNLSQVMLGVLRNI